jgi:hypothetical protein
VAGAVEASSRQESAGVVQAAPRLGSLVADDRFSDPGPRRRRDSAQSALMTASCTAGRTPLIASFVRVG